MAQELPYRPSDSLAVALARAEQSLRQEQETFDQRKKIEYRWSVLRLTMGYSALVLLLAILLVSSLILLDHNSYSPSVIFWAGSALFGDILGLLVAVWKIVLNPGSVTKLEPVTKSVGRLSKF